AGSPEPRLKATFSFQVLPAFLCRQSDARLETSGGQLPDPGMQPHRSDKSAPPGGDYATKALSHSALGNRLLQLEPLPVDWPRDEHAPMRNHSKRSAEDPLQNSATPERLCGSPDRCGFQSLQLSDTTVCRKQATARDGA